MRRLVPALVLAACTSAPSELPPPKVVASGRMTLASAFGDPYHVVVAIGDCDGDGRVEAVRANGTLARWTSGNTPTIEPIPGMSHDEDPTAMLLADVDDDGLFDLVTARQVVNLRRGTGPCTFGPAEVLAPVPAGQPVQILATDADLDGVTDVLLGTREDPAGASRLFLGRGDGSFEELRFAQPPSTGHQTPFQFYAAMIDDVDGDGVRDLFSWNDDGGSFFAWGAPGARPSFEVDRSKLPLFSSTSPMALAVLDADRDGRLDYFVSNVPPESDLLDVRSRTEWRRLGRGAGLGAGDDALWSSYPFDANGDGAPDLLVMRTENTGRYGPALPWLLVNQGDGTFRDEAAMVGLTAPLEARTALCGDLFGDLRPSCLVNDLSVEFRLLRNELDTGGSRIGVRLVGTVSSPDASGARVFEEGEGLQTAGYGLQSPTYGTHDPEVFFSLGTRGLAKLRVQWPSGLETRHEDLGAGTHVTITEPKVVALDRRVVAADGTQVAEITVDLAAAGAKDATVEREGDGTWAGAAVREGDVLKRRLVAPAAPGEARVVVTLDGKALRVRPRVRFVAR